MKILTRTCREPSQLQRLQVRRERGPGEHQVHAAMRQRREQRQRLRWSQQGFGIEQRPCQGGKAASSPESTLRRVQAPLLAAPRSSHACTLAITTRWLPQAGPHPLALRRHCTRSWRVINLRMMTGPDAPRAHTLWTLTLIRT